MHRLLSRLQRAHTLGTAIIMIASFCGSLALAWQGITAEQEAREDLVRALQLTRDAMEIKFLAADFNGWQTAYAFDIIRGVPDATADKGSSRSKFLTSAAAFRAKLEAMKEDWLTDGERLDIKKSKTSFQAFMHLDRRVIAAYRRGRPSDVQEANAFVLGREIEIFQDISKSITRLAESIAERAAVASQRASAATRRSLWLFIGAGIATFLLATSSTLLLLRLVRQEAHLQTQMAAMANLQRRDD